MKLTVALTAVLFFTGSFSAIGQTKSVIGISSWQRSVEKSIKLVSKAIEIGDIDELKVQSLEFSRRIQDTLGWPDTDEWTLARVNCAMMVQEYSNFASDKAKGTARGEVNAEASLKMARGYAADCRKGLGRLK